MIYRPLAVLAAAALLAGCSSASTSDSTPRPALTATASPAPTASFGSAGGSAELVAALAEHVPTVTLTHAFSEDDDLDNLLGRPGGYIGKAAFADSRVPASGRSEDETDVDNGGAVEIFTTTAAAVKRKAYIERILKTDGGSFGTEYLYVSGRALLRVSGSLTPNLAGTYTSAWKLAVAEAL